MTLDLGVNEPFRAAIETAEQLTGIDGAALAALVDAEAAKLRTGASAGLWDRASYNRSSRAAGLTQFLETSWIEHARNAAHRLNADARQAGLVDAGNRVIAGGKAALLALRFEPLLAIVSAAEYGADNLRRLSHAGVLPPGLDDDERARFMYLAHHEGPAGAIGFLKGTRRYSRRNLVGQVGEKKADEVIARCGGDVSAAYRQWLSAYMNGKIVPARFRVQAFSRYDRLEPTGSGPRGSTGSP